MFRPLLLALAIVPLAAADQPPIDLVARFRGDRLEFRTRGVQPDAIGDCLIRAWVEEVEPDGGRGQTLWEVDAAAKGGCASLPLFYGHVPHGMTREEAGPLPKLRPGTVYRVSAKGHRSYEGRFVIERRGPRLHIVDRE